MKSVLKATALLGSSSFVTLVSTLIVYKVAAHQLGPSGFGYQGLLVAFVGLFSLIGGLGIGAGLTKHLSNALESQNSEEAGLLEEEAWRLSWILGACIIVCVIIFHSQINEVFLGGLAKSYEIAICVASILIFIMNSIFSSILNTRQDKRLFVKSTILGTIFSTLINIPGILLFKIDFVAFSILIAALGPFISYIFFTSKILLWPRNFLSNSIIRKKLLTFGIPYTASNFVGFGVQFIIPILILKYYNDNSVGLYRSATAIANTYLSFAINSMSQEYYPRISRTENINIETIANFQMSLLLKLSTPFILIAILFSQPIITTLFSDKFTQSSKILEVLILADVLKFGCWSFSFVILAKLSSTIYFMTELLWGLIITFSAFFFTESGNFYDIGYSFLLAYAAYTIAVLWILNAKLKIRMNTSNLLLMLSAALSGIFIWQFQYNSVIAKLGCIAIIIIWIFISVRDIFKGWLSPNDELKN